jgi:APA family basic amino acid/polyamine antiporter
LTTERPHGFGSHTAIAVVVASMVGTGVFTSLGFQLVDIQSGFVIMMLWTVGGITALCGALTYAELGAALPRSGGEYNFLGQIYHPAAGFVSGWVSATIGFAAPSALAAITFGSYLASVFPWLSPTWLACALIVALTFVHASTHRSSGRVQRVFTAIKVVLIVLFCILAWLLVETPQPIGFLPRAGDGSVLLSGAFAVSLIYVNYAYTGWNAATYLIDELECPQQMLSRVLLIGTSFVLVLYLALNFIFLHVAPVDALKGKIEIGHVAASHVFDEAGAAIMSVSLALLLVSSVSAMTLAGPRVLQVIGQDFAAFRFLAKTNADGVPHVAIAFQSLLAVAFVVSASSEAILVFAGFTLGVNTFFAILGVFVLRLREPSIARPYRVPLFPAPPLLFLGVTGWTLTYILIERPVEGLAGMGIFASGAVFYAVSTWYPRLRRSKRAAR